MQASTTDTTMALFIQSLGTLTNGDRYVGFNTSANETFIVTDTQSGQTGAVAIAGTAFQNSSLAGHVLTLG